MNNWMYLCFILTLIVVSFIIQDFDFNRKLKRAQENKGVPQRLIFGGIITITNNFEYAIVKSVWSGPSGAVEFMLFETHGEAVNHIKALKKKAIDSGINVDMHNGSDCDFTQGDRINTIRYQIIHKANFEI